MLVSLAAIDKIRAGSLCISAGTGHRQLGSGLVATIVKYVEDKTGIVLDNIFVSDKLNKVKEYSDVRSIAASSAASSATAGSLQGRSSHVLDKALIPVPTRRQQQALNEQIWNRPDVQKAFFGGLKALRDGTFALNAQLPRGAGYPAAIVEYVKEKTPDHVVLNKRSVSTKLNKM
ncbi:hypothetical protein JCM10213_007586 [Rhodosporidiobolus nylandii]